MTEQAPERILTSPNWDCDWVDSSLMKREPHHVEYLHADLAKPRVRLLEWDTGIVHWATPLPGMKYVVCLDGPGRPCSWWLDGAEAETRQVRPSEEAAKAAAQADYEHRILSTLILSDRCAECTCENGGDDCN